MLSKLKAGDLYVLGVYTAWLAVFVLLVSLLRESGVGLDVVKYLAEHKGARETPLYLTAALLIASTMLGLRITNPVKQAGWHLPAAIALASVNMLWLCAFYAHFVLAGIPAMAMFLVMVVPFYVIWLAQQTGGVARVLLYAAPTVGAYLLIQDRDLAVGVTATVAALSLIYALSIYRVESAAVDRDRKAFALLLFVQSVALFALAMKIVDLLDGERDARSAAEVAAVASFSEFGGPFLQRISFGMPVMILVYSAALWVPILWMASFTEFGINWGLGMVAGIWTFLLLASILDKRTKWGYASVVLFVQMGLGALIGLNAVFG